MPFNGSCPSTKRVRLIASPTLEDGVTPAPIDPNNPLTATAPNGETGFLSEPVSGTPTECYVSMPNGFNGNVAIKVTGDADMGDGFVELTDTGSLDFVTPQATILGVGVSAPEDKL